MKDHRKVNQILKRILIVIGFPVYVPLAILLCFFFFVLAVIACLPYYVVTGKDLFTELNRP